MSRRKLWTKIDGKWIPDVDGEELIDHIIKKITAHFINRMKEGITKHAKLFEIFMSDEAKRKRDIAYAIMKELCKNMTLTHINTTNDGNKKNNFKKEKPLDSSDSELSEPSEDL